MQRCRLISSRVVIDWHGLNQRQIEICQFVLSVCASPWLKYNLYAFEFEFWLQPLVQNYLKNRIYKEWATDESIILAFNSIRAIKEEIERIATKYHDSEYQRLKRLSFEEKKKNEAEFAARRLKQEQEDRKQKEEAVRKLEQLRKVDGELNREKGREYHIFR